MKTKRIKYRLGRELRFDGDVFIVRGYEDSPSGVRDNYVRLERIDGSIWTVTRFSVQCFVDRERRGRA
jgi:hypothetical protein